MRRWLGPVWWAMHRKFYVDELYNYTIVPLYAWLWPSSCTGSTICGSSTRLSTPSAASPIALARFCGDVDRMWSTAWSMGLPGWPHAQAAILRNAQNGQVQVYLMVVVVSDYHLAAAYGAADDIDACLRLSSSESGFVAVGAAARAYRSHGLQTEGLRRISSMEFLNQWALPILIVWPLL